MEEDREEAMQARAASVVKVGAGRGFVIEYRMKLKIPASVKLRLKLRNRFLVTKHRLIVTAAHCLPKLPRAFAGGWGIEDSYTDLLGSLNGSKSDVWAECVFADPVADIAVLGCPDQQELGDQADAYHDLTDGVQALRIGNVRNGQGWVLALSGRWVRTPLKVIHGGQRGDHLTIGATEAGMSGSPILSDAGRVVGVVAIGCGTVSEGIRKEVSETGPQPILALDLPRRILRGQC